MNTRIDNTPRIQADYERAQRTDNDQPLPENGQLLVPASYAAVGGTFELLMLMLEASKAQKDGTREARGVAEAALSQAQAAQVQDIRDKASMQLGKAAAGAVVSVANAAGQIHSTNQQIKLDQLDSRTDQLSRQLAQPNATSLTHAERELSVVRNQASDIKAELGYLEAGSKLLEASGTLVGGAFDSAITNKDADATVNQQKAETLRRSVDQLGSELDDIKGHEDKLISYARDIEAAKNRCTQIAMQSR